MDVEVSVSNEGAMDADFETKTYPVVNCTLELIRFVNGTSLHTSQRHHLYRTEVLDELFIVRGEISIVCEVDLGKHQRSLPTRGNVGSIDD